MFDLISIGDTIIDQYFQIAEAHIQCNIDKSKCELCLNYSDKIGVEGYQQLIGGNAANNSVGSARLKLKTAVFTNIGDDPFGQKIIKHFKTEKVDGRFIKTNSDLESSVSAVISFKGERTILGYHQPWIYDLPDLGQTKWIYFSSLAHSFSDTNIVSQLENYIQRTGINLGFNPGTFQIKYGVRKYPKLLSLTTIIFLNLHEAKKILSIDLDQKTEIKKLLTGIADLGPKMVVITDGKNGSYGYDGNLYYQLGLFPAKLVEATGAGDAYATGVVAGLFYGQDLPKAMRWGAANSASVVEQVGAQAGLLTYHQMIEKLQQNSKIVAKII